jgi:hypothetical protein
MKVRGDAASKNWEKLFSILQECINRGSGYDTIDADLSDSKADRYDFANEIRMRRMRERLVEALQRIPMWIDNLKLGSKFFMTMNEEQQRSFFHSICSLPVRNNAHQIKVWNFAVGDDETGEWTESRAITINTSVLLETLPQLHRFGGSLILNNFALTRQSDVQALSNLIGSKCEHLRYLALESIECPVDECTKQDSDESNGFLDPLLRAEFGLHELLVSTKMRYVHSTLVSPTALRSLFVEGNQFRSLSLRGLGLNDSHVLAIVDGLSTPDTHLDWLILHPILLLVLI